MNAVIGCGGIAVFFLIVISILEFTKKQSSGFSEYATAGRSFGSWFSTMAFLNTWLPGTMFISFAGFAAAFLNFTYLIPCLLCPA